jgi:acetyl-CoA carboxylase biotin carboxyl carrier protein
VTDLKAKTTELAQWMAEFSLTKAKLQGEGWSVAFERPEHGDDGVVVPVVRPQTPALVEEDLGTPVTSPMMGIFYAAPSVGAPPFVQVGDVVTAGQIIGLIEAMKVFNEIPATVSGTVTKIQAGNGDLVQPGDPLIYIR